MGDFERDHPMYYADILPRPTGEMLGDMLMQMNSRTKRTLQGRAYVYKAAIRQEAAMKSAVRDLVDRMFSGSAESLLMNLIETENIDEATFERLRKTVSDRERG